MPRLHKLTNYVALRKNLRNSATDAERTLWHHLQQRQLLGLKFRRQYGIHHYIIDFYCPEIRLGIELDGGWHFRPDQRDRDLERTQKLADYGIRILRFTNNDVLNNINGVLEILKVQCSAPKAPPQA